MSKCPEFQGRRAEYPIDALFLKRWSPRAMSGEAIPPKDLLTILEAARWAPSAHNAQPWRFLYATRNDPWWAIFLKLLSAERRTWIKKAGALVIILASTHSEHDDDRTPTYSFDAGGACQNACLQATMLGLASHVVQVLDEDLVRETLDVPTEYSIQFGLVLGNPGKRSDLAPELQAKEGPRLRRPLSDLAFVGGFSTLQNEPADYMRRVEAFPAARTSFTLPAGPAE
jgi:nitroreductase